jgi:RNA polymerase sigma-70 factor (ECF subfamily)
MHRRLLEGDPTASSDVAVAYLEPLVRALSVTGIRADDHDYQTAVEDALLSYIKGPGKYDPSRAPLATYLRMAARSDLKNLQAKATRYTGHTRTIEDVELSPAHRNSLHDTESNPESLVILGETIRERAERNTVPVAVMNGLTPQEKAVLDLMRSGERRTSFYVDALGIEEWPAAEQRAEVKRIKDRLKVRIKRAGGSDD